MVARVCYPELEMSDAMFSVQPNATSCCKIVTWYGQLSRTITKQLIAQTLLFSNRVKASNNNDTGCDSRNLTKGLANEDTLSNTNTPVLLLSRSAKGSWYSFMSEVELSIGLSASSRSVVSTVSAVHTAKPGPHLLLFSLMPAAPPAELNFPTH
jgi:hypothetical protein